MSEKSIQFEDGILKIVSEEKEEIVGTFGEEVSNENETIEENQEEEKEKKVEKEVKSKEKGKGKKEVITLDNRPMAPELVEEKEKIHPKFADVKPQKPVSSNNTIKVRNGRVYKDLGNGIGMYADNGQVFRI